MKTRYDYLTIIGEPRGIAKKDVVVDCKCDCGRVLTRKLYGLEKDSVYFKACMDKGCEFSRIRNPATVDSPQLAMSKATDRRTREKRKALLFRTQESVFELKLRTQFLSKLWTKNMGWSQIRELRCD